MALGINWLGHSCFLIRLSNGKRIVMDPYDPSIGPLPAELTADFVTMSHQHFDHNYLKGVKGKYSTVQSGGMHEFEGFRVTGIPSWHDEQMGAQRGPNMIYILESEGIKVCHLGDLGVIPSKDELLRLEGIDMLLIPIGGTYTIDPKAADKLISIIKPRIIMPMHYSMQPGIKRLLPLSDFLEGKENVQYAKPGEYMLDKTELNGPYPKYLVLTPNLTN